MNILVAFNDGYVMPTKVMLKSLIYNNKCELNIYIFYFSLSEGSITSLKELEKYANVNLFFVHIEDNEFGNFSIPENSLFPKEAYIRLFEYMKIPKDVDRILYLDGDMIINKSIEEFYSQDFSGKLYVAVKDQNVGEDENIHRKLNMPLEVKYINSGVLLMDLNGIREKIDKNAIIEFIQSKGSLLKYADQDVINGLLFHYIKVVESDCYNHFAGFSFLGIPKNVCIVHFAGEAKPWKKHYKAEGFHLFWKYALQDSNEYRSICKEVYPSYVLLHLRHEIFGCVKKISPKLYRNIVLYIQRQAK